MKQETITIAEKEITFETGEIATLTNGAVLVRQQDTVVLVTVAASETPKEDLDFFPLSVEYREKSAAAGKIPGGFIKRESRPQDREILISRLIDRSIRPLFPENFRCETQVIATLLSYDRDADPAPLAIMAASAALTISDIPWNGPVAGIRLAQKNTTQFLFPTAKQRKNAKMDLVLSCVRDGIVMLEGLAEEASEEDILQAMKTVQESMSPFFDMLEKWKEISTPKRELEEEVYPEGLEQEVEEKVKEKLIKVISSPKSKLERKKEIQKIAEDVREKLLEKNEENEPYISLFFSKAKNKIFREFMLKEKKRIDGRNFDEIRDITGKVSWLPRPHGSAIFTRGETQAVVTCTMGTMEDEQIVDSLDGEEREKFFLHYNFPPYSVGEVRPLRGPGRREIGHGTLAHRALQNIIPSQEEFPYTVRVVSDITQSNGSSSMATVCGGCLALMDAGVPIKTPIAGIAMGLIQQNDQTIILSDILGDEDHFGDMDFKVAGSDKGITAVQMDNKIGSLSEEVMKKALEQARQGRMHILEKMKGILPEARKEMSKHAPRVEIVTIRKERIRDLIGPGGKNINMIQDDYNVRIDINSDNGVVRVFSYNKESCVKAMKMVDFFTKELEVGKVYRGKVVSVKDFGAFVRIYANTEGLVHISELDNKRIAKVRDVVNEGDEIIVRVLGIDRAGKIRLSRKEAFGVPADKIEN